MKIAPSVAAGGYSLSVTKTKPFIICIIQKQSPGVVLSERCLKKFRKIHRKIPVTEYFLNKVVKKRDYSTGVFSCEFCDISKNNFLHRTPLVAASEYFDTGFSLLTEFTVSSYFCKVYIKISFSQRSEGSSGLA